MSTVFLTTAAPPPLVPLRVPFPLVWRTDQGHVRVSVYSGAPPTEEELAELAFEGRPPPPPLGCVRVPVADLAGLERRWAAGRESPMFFCFRCP